MSLETKKNITVTLVKKLIAISKKKTTSTIRFFFSGNQFTIIIILLSLKIGLYASGGDAVSPRDS